MSNHEVFSINEFAKFTRTTRDTLLYYDSIGLLKPVSRGENKYRYYSSGQLGVINLIRTCQELGMSLTEIKKLSARRTPAVVDQLLERQIELIDGKISEWVRARKLLHVLKQTIHYAMDADENAISVQFMPAEAIVLGELNDYSQGRTVNAALLSFYYACKDKYPDIGLNYSVWGMFSEDRIKRRDFIWPSRFYFYNPEGYDIKPAALYAIGYTRGDYGESADLYERMLEYIDANGFEICGPAFEEYPLNEMCIAEEKNYLMRIMIVVRERKNG
ncbi:MAG: MerR family transcriptional regulator [Clostridia bacterium]|nr:MerR family transcriptional regulator [Clostridia bacterium]